MSIEYALNGIIRAVAEAFCLNIILPLFYLFIKTKEAVKGFDN